MDLNLLTDEELDQSLNEILAEKERRQRLNDIPGQIALLSKAFVNDGGDPQVIQQSVAVTPTP